MKHTVTHIASLILKKISGQLTEAEAKILEDWKMASAANQQLYEELLRPEVLRKELKDFRMAQKIGQQIAVPEIETSGISATPVRLRSTAWWRYAAVFMIAIGVGLYFFSRQPSPPISNVDNGKQTLTDVAPGTNRAVLTINNNEKIDLASDKKGINISNTITYDDGKTIADAGQVLQVATPRGGQYQVTLPDGSKVWLNAASSIKFPSKFSAAERKVEITGEVYFEIAKDAKRLFKVSGAGQEIEVLGTSFNINVYENEPARKTTLVTGSIKITSNHQTAILKPGQQASMPTQANAKLRLSQVQTDEVLAWKNGLINFDGATFEDIMRQVERWYNIEVVYEKNSIPNKVLAGAMTRDVPLNGLLKYLGEMGLRYKLDNRTLTILH